MKRSPSATVCVGGLAVLSVLFAASWAGHRAERTREVASAALGRGTDVLGLLPSDFKERFAAMELGNRSEATAAALSGTLPVEADLRELPPLEPVPQPDTAWESPLGDSVGQGDGRLEVDEECRPVAVARWSRFEPLGERAASGVAEKDEPTIAPPDLSGFDGGRQVIQVLIEAEQAAGKRDVLQP